MMLKKLLRTLLRYKAQFISMAIMTALGIGVFLGFSMEWRTLEVNTQKIYDQTGFADFRIYDTENGFSAEDAARIAALNGVQDVTRFASVNMSAQNTSDVVALTVSENMAVSGILLMEGEKYDPESEDGMWLSDSYAKENGIKLGDTLTLTYKEFTVTGTVKGLIKSSEYLICLIDDTQLMPDYSSCGYVYVSGAMLERLVDEESQKLLDANPLYRLAGQSRIEAEKTKYLNRLFMQINVKSTLTKAELIEKADAALGRTCLVVSKEETVSYAEVQGEIEEGKTMVSILPVLFLAIGVLTMVTTMHRITANEKTQIGTLKALGFRDKRILIHYSCFALVIGLLGTLLGAGIGYLIAWYIMRPDGAMGTYIDMPYWTLTAPWYTWLVIALIDLMLVFIGFMSVKKMLRGTAADALRPYTPNRVKHLALEETKAFKRLSFGTKWNLRDCFRHKSRSFMTLFGVLGCVILIVGGLGMKDTMDVFVNKFYDEAINYSVRVNLNAESAVSEDDPDGARESYNQKALALAQKLKADWSSQFSAQIGDQGYLIEIYDVTQDKVRFLDDDLEIMTLGDEGVYICSRIARDLDIGKGSEISFSPYGSDKNYTVKVAGITRELSKSVVMTRAYAEKAGINYTINALYTDETDVAGDAIIQNTQTKQAIMDSFDTFMELMNTMVALLVLAAIVLGIVVLYNLGVMSYVERYREMATLKVVGFRDKKIGRLLITQNLWLSLIGIILGIPAGALVLDYLIKALAGEYEMKLAISPFTYIFSVALTLGVSLIVGLMVARKNKRIDMVAALKTEE
ncbi:MAG: FtsX-like permease family protein [Clostridia bacterium]|nr:FtsX-like permease family protein [Clostridia bacterium]